MDKTLAKFLNDFYLNYWHNQCHPVIKPLIEEHLPFLLADSGGWTAYLTETPDERLLEQKPVTITFEEHPNWKSDYEEVCFAVLLKMFQGKCIGHYSSQLIFSYPTKHSLQIAAEELVSFCKELEPNLVTRRTGNEFSIHSADSSTNAYFKTKYHLVTKKEQLFFSTVPFFFKHD